MLEFVGLSAGDAASPPRSQERVSISAGEGQSRSSSFGNLNIAGPDSCRPADIKSPKPQPRKTVSPETVLQSFNTWAFKRAQPADPQLMLAIISESIARGAPVPFVLYWGKGPRCGLDAPDIECLDFLTGLARRVRAAYTPGAIFQLIFTDTHAELNGHSPQSIHDYFGAIDVAARQRGFESCWLNQLTRAAEAAAARDPFDDSVSEDTLQRLSACAAKWYRGDGTAEQGALKYYQMNMIEKRAVQLAFPRSIFVTFSGNEFRCLFPDRLPIFFMYSLRRGVSVKPWFLPHVTSFTPETTDRP